MNTLLKEPRFYVLTYIVLINTYGLIIMAIDKWKSSRRKWRIPEKNFFITALIGGALGVYWGMKAFHHKTLHKKFKYGIPAILVLNAAALGYVFYRIW